MCKKKCFYLQGIIIETDIFVLTNIPTKIFCNIKVYLTKTIVLQSR